MASKKSVTAVALLLWVPAALAEVSATLSVTQGKDDNYRLTERAEDRVDTTAAEFGLRWGWVGPTSRVQVQAQTRHTQLHGSDFDDQTSHRVTARYDGESKTMSYGGAVTWQRRDLLQSTDFVDRGIGADPTLEQPDLDVTLVEDAVERDEADLSAYVGFKLNRRTELQIASNFRQVDYDRLGERFGLQGSDTVGVALRLKRDVSRQDKVAVRHAVAQFQPDVVGETRFTESAVSWTRETSKRTKLHLEAGRWKADTQGFAAESGMLWRGIAEHKTSQWRARLLLEQTTYPSGLGEPVEFQRAAVWLNRALGRKWDVEIIAQKNRARSPQGLTQNDRDYAELNTAFRYALSRSTRLKLGHRYQHLNRKRRPGDAEGHGAFVTFEYTPRSRQ